MSDGVRICSHGRPLNFPGEIWVGVHDTEWPMQAFGSADHASSWVNEDPRNRHAYRVDGTITGEAKYVPPVPATYKVIPVTAPQPQGGDQ